MARQVDRKDTIAWRRCRGMNSWDSPDDLAEDFAADVVNVAFEQGGLGSKRRGSIVQPITFTTAPPGYAHLAPFVPAGGAAVAELFIVGANGAMWTVRTGTTALDLTLADAALDAPPIVHTAQLNNKLFIAYRSAENRLHVLDAGGTTVRRTGLLAPPAPVVTDVGVGTYPSTLRYYRVQWATYGGATVLREGALGPATAFTPSGTALAAQISLPPLPGQGENAWRIYVSADNATYYRLASLFIANTTFDDTTIVGTWTGELAPLEGTFTNWPSVRFLCSTGDRLLGFGVYNPEAAVVGDVMPPLVGRVYFSPVLNTTDADDDERVSNTLQHKGWIDIARNAGGVDRGIAQAVDNQIMVAQSQGLYLLIPTGQDTSPYRRVALSPTLGWVSQWSAFPGEDEAGRPALYFLDPQRGPYRYGARGLEWLGYDIQTLWARFDKDAPPVQCHGQYLSATRECRWIVPILGPNVMVINFNVRLGQAIGDGSVRGGWAQYTGRQSGAPGPYAAARTSVMFSEVFSTPRTAVLRLYLGFADLGLGAPLLLRMDEPGVYEDGVGTTLVQSYSAYLVSKAWLVPPDQNVKQIIRAWLKAKSATGVVIMMGALRNYSDEHRYATVTLTPVPDQILPPPLTPMHQARVQKRFNDASLVDAFAFQIAIGDPGLMDASVTSPAQGWTLDQWIATIEYGAET